VTGANLSMLLALVEKSMVRRVQDGRFDLHELVRQYAAQRLIEPETILNAHAEAYLVLWCTYDANLPTSQGAKTREILIADLDNFRAAWDWAMIHKKFDFIKHALHAVWGFHEINGTYAELTAQMLPVAEAAQASDPYLYGRARTYQAWAHLRQGQILKAQSLLDEALESLLPFNEPASLFEAYFFKGVSHIISGDWASAQHWLAEARTYADASGNPRYIAQATVNYCGVLAIVNNDEESFSRLRAALDRLLELDLVRAYLTALNTYTVQVAMRLKCLPELYQPLTESLALYEQSGDRWISAVTHSNLGTVLAAMGDMQEARSHVAQSLLLFKELGSQADMAFTHLRYGRVEVVANDIMQAELHFRESIHIGQNADAYMAVAEAAIELAKVWANDNKNATRSLMLCIYLIGQPTLRTDLRASAEQLRTQLETRLTSAEVNSAQAQAKAKSLAELTSE
jgi:tetratricopeptide (TPR) repeat protein